MTTQTEVQVQIAADEFVGFIDGTRHWVYYWPKDNAIYATYTYGNAMPAFIYNGHFAIDVPNNADGETVRQFCIDNAGWIVDATNGDESSQENLEFGQVLRDVPIRMSGEDYIDHCLNALSPRELFEEIDGDPESWAAQEVKQVAEWRLIESDLASAAEKWLEQYDPEDWD